ncbi:MAG: hypothetical protein ACHQ0Y_13215 [Thermodesulfovibrionales bacterium]
MRIGFKGIKKSHILLITLITLLGLLVGGTGAYLLMGSKKDTGRVSPPPSLSSSLPLKPAPLPLNVPPNQPLTAAPHPTAKPEIKQTDKSFVEKDPFKADFLERFKKASLPKGKGGPQLTEMIPLQKILDTPPQMELVKQDQNSQKQKPQFKIYGIYVIHGKSVALTDKGDIRAGMDIEGHKVTEVDNESIALDGVDTRYYITRGKNENK